MKCPLLRRSYLMTARFISIRDSTLPFSQALAVVSSKRITLIRWNGLAATGRLHQTGCKQRFTARPEIGVQEYLLEPRQVFEQATLIPSGLKADFLKATDKLIAAVMEQWHGRGNTLRLHGDCHAGNILWRDGPLFVDLDDARTGPAIQDLWMLLNGDKAEQRMQLETIVEAYEEFSPFNSDEIALIEPLRAMRLVYYLAWLLRRWDDPAFPVNFLVNRGGLLAGADVDFS